MAREKTPRKNPARPVRRVPGAGTATDSEENPLGPEKAQPCANPGPVTTGPASSNLSQLNQNVPP